MFYRKTILALFAVMAVLCGSQTAVAAISQYRLDLDRDRNLLYIEMLGFLQTNGGRNRDDASTFFIPVSPTSSTDLLQVILVSNNYFGGINLNVYVNPTNLYIIGFSTSSNPTDVVYFSDTGNDALLRRNGLTPERSIGSGSYAALDPNATIRRGLNFNINAIRNLLANLVHFDIGGPIPNPVTSALLVLTQWLSEAARFIPIRAVMENAILNNLDPAYLSPQLIAAENNWGVITNQVDQSYNHDGQLPVPQLIGGTTLADSRSVRYFGLGLLLGTQFTH